MILFTKSALGFNTLARPDVLLPTRLRRQAFLGRQFLLLAAVLAMLCLLVAPGYAQTPTNNQPAFPSSETGDRSVAENVASGTDVGAPVAATDADGDSLTHTLSGDDAAAFSIVAATGQLRTNASLNREAQAYYTVTVSVSDRKDDNNNLDAAIDDAITVTVEITNVDEPGTASISSARARVARCSAPGWTTRTDR